MADIFVALPPVTAYGAVIFGKNSHRPATEVQDVVYVSARTYGSGEKVKCTYTEVDQVTHTHAVILSKPPWMWGAEMGANEKGVAVGNAPVWTKLNGPEDLEQRLLGTDIVRLALERASSARQAVDVITQLLATPGQGGSCTDNPQTDGWCCHNSFLAADATEAWVVESAGPLWAAERITEGVRNISNELSIRTKQDLMSPDLVQDAKARGLYVEEAGLFDFKATFSAQTQSDLSPASNTNFRSRHGRELLEKAAASGGFRFQDMFSILRDEDSGICMMDGGFVTAGSQVSALMPDGSPCVHWFTATPNTATSIYKPFFFGPGADIGDLTLSREDSAAEPGHVGHALYRSHKRLCHLMDSQEERGHAVLGQLRELEKKCCEDVEDILANYDESSFPKLRQIFKHMASMEINFYL